MKSIFKNTVLVLLVTVMTLLTAIATAQTKDFKTVFSFGIDPKMATVGAYPDREGNKPSFDYEVSFGFEWTHTRVLMQYKSHEAINFSKWTYLQFDYKKKVFKNVYIYAGLEVAQVKRTHPDAHYSNMDNYRDATINPILFGANLEAQYKFNDWLAAALQLGVYQAEDVLKPYKDYRTDGTVALYISL